MKAPPRKRPKTKIDFGGHFGFFSNLAAFLALQIILIDALTSTTGEDTKNTILRDNYISSYPYYNDTGTILAEFLAAILDFTNIP